MSGEKQFEATPSRLAKAKREGDVARSAEVAAAAAFACGLAATAVVAPAIGACAFAMLSSATAGTVAGGALAGSIALMLVPPAAAVLGSCGAATLQSGGVQFVALQWKSERLNPAENLKRMLSRESAIAAARGVAAFLCACVVIVPAIEQIFGASLHAGGIRAIAGAAWIGALRNAWVACITGSTFALVDLGLQVARRRRRLRMSADELKRDQKEQDGDPAARSKRRSLHRALSRGSLHRVRDAAFLVTNPTHIAIALEYRPPAVPVPRVLVRSADSAAARVRALAARYGIPVVENVGLARCLYSAVRPGDFIPQETYVAVAEIVTRLHLAKAGNPRA